MKKPILIVCLSIYWPIYSLCSLPSKTWLRLAVCVEWRQGVKESLARRESLSFSGWKMDDESTTRLVHLAYSLKELDISRSRWGCQITDHGLKQLSTAKCIGNLSSISKWGSTGITDKGVVQLTLLKSFHKGLPKVRTQISLAVAALAVHVPAEDWGDGGILNWIGDEMNSHPECILSFLELLKVLPEVQRV